MSGVMSSTSSGITSLISFAIGATQLSAESAMSLAVSTVASTACFAMLVMASKRPLFCKDLFLELEQGDLPQSKSVLDR